MGIFVASECLDPLPHVSVFVAAEMLFDALFVFKLSLFDGPQQGLMCLDA